jgi:hypothetical protein
MPTILIDAAVLCAALGTVIVGSLAYNPRLWLQDAPPRARALAPPLSPSERRVRLLVAGLFVVALVSVTAWSGQKLIARHGATLRFATALAHYLAVFSLFNLFDLLVIDWLLLLVMRPAFLSRLSVPGLSYEETVGGFRYHFRAFLKGLGFVAAMSLIAAGAAVLAG